MSTASFQHLPWLVAGILAGGRSRRMGRDKALLTVEGRPLIERVVRAVLPLTADILISCNDEARLRFLNFPLVPDVFAGQGPMAGLHAVASSSTRPLILLVACDMPGLRTAVLERLLSFENGNDAVVPCSADGRVHPLCALYRRSCLPILEEYLRQGRNRMTDFLKDPRLVVRRLDGSEGGYSDADLVNVNLPEELALFGIK
jgi:molybdopterin-guanine dinucleotide biosynthesis protein A